MTKEQDRDAIKTKAQNVIREALARERICGHHDLMSVAFIELAAEQLVEWSFVTNREPDLALYCEILRAACERIAGRV